MNPNTSSDTNPLGLLNYGYINLGLQEAILLLQGKICLLKSIQKGKEIHDYGD
jgi:hypothetical protein